MSQNPRRLSSRGRDGTSWVTGTYWCPRWGSVQTHTGPLSHTSRTHSYTHGTTSPNLSGGCGPTHHSHNSACSSAQVALPHTPHTSVPGREPPSEARLESTVSPPKRPVTHSRDTLGHPTHVCGFRAHASARHVGCVRARPRHLSGPPPGLPHTARMVAAHPAPLLAQNRLTPATSEPATGRASVGLPRPDSSTDSAPRYDPAGEGCRTGPGCTLTGGFSGGHGWTAGRSRPRHGGNLCVRMCA